MKTVVRVEVRLFFVFPFLETSVCHRFLRFLLNAFFSTIKRTNGEKSHELSYIFLSLCFCAFIVSLIYIYIDVYSLSLILFCFVENIIFFKLIVYD